MINFSIYDFIIIIFYFIIILVIGLKTRTNDKNDEDYLVAGRKITLPAFVATLVSSFYGGILGIGEFTYNYGVSSWLLNAFPYYFFITIFAFFLAKKIRKTELFTIPEKLENVYGRRVGILGGVFVFLLVTPAPYILMLGVLVQVIFGWNLVLSMIITLIFSIVYLFKGGLRADIRVNIFEFVLMFLGFGIILPFCIIRFGGLNYLNENLPAAHLSLTGSNSIQLIVVWFFIGSWALVDPSFHQRCYAAKSGSTAKAGVFISLLFWFIFDFLTTTTGLYAASYLKNIPDPKMSYPLFANDILPPLAKGFFFVGMLATIMSTLHTNIFISATTLGKDIISKFKKNDDLSNKFTKIGIIITSILSLGIAILIPSVVQIWYTIGTLIIPALLISVISSYSKMLIVNERFIFMAMIVSFFVSLTYFILGYINKVNGMPVYFLGLEPLYPGLFLGLIIYFTGVILKNRNN
ncbi:MAG TPA: sodium:solute symporter family protein [Ignavibacteria bacterium]